MNVGVHWLIDLEVSYVLLIRIGNWIDFYRFGWFVSFRAYLFRSVQWQVYVQPSVHRAGLMPQVNMDFSQVNTLI